MKSVWDTLPEDRLSELPRNSQSLPISVSGVEYEDFLRTRSLALGSSCSCR